MKAETTCEALSSRSDMSTPQNCIHIWHNKIRETPTRVSSRIW